MIIGVGTDIVDVRRMQVSLQRHGRRFAERILAVSELAEFDASATPAHYLAKRFAAEEAAAKALGCGFRHGISLRHIWVTRDKLGKPGLAFEGQAEHKCEEASITSAHLSLSDERHYALAFVVLES